MSDKYIVTCDGCDQDFVPDVQKMNDGECEIYFIQCPSCGDKYLISVIDQELRSEISEYAALEHNNRVSRLSKQMQKRMWEMKKRNIKRSNELKKRYMKRIREGFNDKC